MSENNYRAYQEGLTRCGAWTELVVALRDQHDRHQSEPDATPAVAPSQLAGTIKLADRLVKAPRHRSLHPVDLGAFKSLCAQLKSLVGPDIWAETSRLMRSNERFEKASKSPISPSSLPEQDDEDYAPWE